MIDKREKPQPINVFQWLFFAKNTLQLSIEEFWSMPFFVLLRLAESANNKPKPPTRAEYLDGYRERKKRLGWV